MAFSGCNSPPNLTPFEISDGAGTGFDRVTGGKVCYMATAREQAARVATEPNQPAFIASPVRDHACRYLMHTPTSLSDGAVEECLQAAGLARVTAGLAHVRAGSGQQAAEDKARVCLCHRQGTVLLRGKQTMRRHRIGSRKRALSIGPPGLRYGYRREVCRTTASMGAHTH